MKSDAGFNHCALIYGSEKKSAESFVHYVARCENGASTRQWGFDCFLFLTHFVRGMNTEIGALNQADFQTVLDCYFAENTHFAALDRAIGEVSEKLGEAPPGKRKVIIMLPWLDPSVTDFGTVGGKKVSLATAAGRKKAAKWYVEQAEERFKRRYKYLELWGFYWMRENLTSNPNYLKPIADAIHERGLKLLWIPYYLANGYRRWKEVGVDVAIMQSNYVFNSADTGGSARTNRISATADRCKQYGMGFEIELFSSAGMDPDKRAYFLKTLELGHRDHYGFQHVPTAYYLGGSRGITSSQAGQENLYGVLFDYLAGKKITYPRIDRWEVGKTGGKIVAECALPRSVSGGNVDVFFDEPPHGSPHWQGVGRLFAWKNGAWSPVGWSLRTTFNDDEMHYQALTIPFSEAADRLKIELTGSDLPAVTDIRLESGVPPVDWSERLSEPLPELSAQVGAAIDSGEVAACHALYGHRTEVARSYSLASTVTCDRIVVFTATRPTRAALAIAADFRPFSAANGRGALQETRVFEGKISNGKISFQLPAPMAVGGFTVFQRFAGYGTFGKVVFQLRGKVVTPGNITSCGHTGACNVGGDYYDDGVVASTGVVPTTLNGMVGWRGETPREFVVKAERPADKVMVGVFSSALQKVDMPKKITVATSADGKTWSPPRKMAMPVNREKSNVLRLLYAEAALAAPAMFVKVAVWGGKNLTLIKNILTI